MEFDFFRIISRRFFRIKTEAVGDISGTTVHPEASPVEWLNDWLPGNFFSIPSDESLSQNIFYQQGKIFGIDAASAAAVRALSVEKKSVCLDLCCAPGGKLFLISELSSLAVGVDITEHRLFTTRAIARKYGIRNIRLFKADGQTFSGANPGVNLFTESKKRKRDVKRESWDGFDRVLVDAECTHDASLRHVKKQEKIHGTFNSPWEGKKSDLFDLQLRLLLNGFENLNAGGVLVYSTCSGDPGQNECVVRAFLAQTVNVVLDALPFGLDDCKATRVNIKDEDVICSCYFDPSCTGTSGLFICRFRKL